METRCTDNLIYEHKHDGYGWHPNIRTHRKRTKKSIISRIEICINCGEVGKAGVDLNYDEYIDRFLCDRCDLKEEIRKLGR